MVQVLGHSASLSRRVAAAAQLSIVGSAQPDPPTRGKARALASETMRAVVITKHGDLSVLQVQERPDPPPPGPGQVRIAVRAAGVNFADHLARVGLYPDAPKPPAVVGYEVAGIIEAVGDGVDPQRGWASGYSQAPGSAATRRSSTCKRPMRCHFPTR